YQHRIAARFVERAIGFHRQLVAGQHLPAGKRKRLIEADELGGDNAYRPWRHVARGLRGRDRNGNRGKLSSSDFGHMDLFSWIYEAPASGSSKSAHFVENRMCMTHIV